jgi:glutamate carboxypeptidase
MLVCGIVSAIPQSIQSLSSQKKRFSDLLVRWSEQNSGSTNEEGLGRMRLLLIDAFARIPGAKIEELPLPGTARKALSVVQRPGAALTVLCSGHYDTVYDAAHPFQKCRFDEERLHGPGVADMKGGLAVMLAALEAFEATPGAERLGWQVLLTPDEEIGSSASKSLILETARKHGLALVFEPARGNGDLVKSRMATGTFKAICKGRAAHAARVPNEGRNAIVALAEFLLGVHALPSKIPGILVNIGSIRGGGPVNIVPDHAEADINIRISRKADRALVDEQLASLAAMVDEREGLRLIIEGAIERHPKECGPVEHRLFEAWNQAASDLGLPPFGWQHSGGGSDGNLLSEAGLPNLDGVGIVGDHLHSDREYCEIASLTDRARLAALVLHRLAQGLVVLG